MLWAALYLLPGIVLAEGSFRHAATVGKRGDFSVPVYLSILILWPFLLIIILIRTATGRT